MNLGVLCLKGSEPAFLHKRSYFNIPVSTRSYSFAQLWRHFDFCWSCVWLPLCLENSWGTQNIFTVLWTSEVVQTMALVSWASNSVKSGKISRRSINAWWKQDARTKLFLNAVCVKAHCFWACLTLHLFFPSATTCCIPRRTKKTKFYCMP